MFAPAGERLVRLRADARRRRARAPSGPSATGHVVSIVCAWKTSESIWRSRSSSSSSRIGFAITSWRACSGVSSSRLRSEPTLACDAHHDRLADRVDRRVRHLREQLLEVRVEQRLPVGEDRERQVVAHRADRLLGVPRERREDHLHVVLRVAERELALAQRLGGAGEVLPRRQILEPHDLVAGTTRRTAAARRPSASPPRPGRSGRSRRRRGTASRAAAGPSARTFSGASSSTPVSDARITQPSAVSSHRPGRRPLRSSVAPITRPSVNAIAAGPSQASIRHWW